MTVQAACCCGGKSECCVLDEGDAGVGYPSSISVSWNRIWQIEDGICNIGSLPTSAHYKADHCLQTGVWREDSNGCVTFDPYYVNGSNNTYGSWHYWQGEGDNTIYSSPVVSSQCEHRTPNQINPPSCKNPCSPCSCAEYPASHLCEPAAIHACAPPCNGGTVGNSGCWQCPTSEPCEFGNCASFCSNCCGFCAQHPTRLGRNMMSAGACNCHYDCSDFTCENLTPYNYTNTCWQIPVDEWSHERGVEAGGGICWQENPEGHPTGGYYDRSVSKCNRTKGSLSVLSVGISIGAGGHYYTPANYNNQNQLVSGNEQAPLVATISRTVAAASYDYNGKHLALFDAQYSENDYVCGIAATPTSPPRAAVQYDFSAPDPANVTGYYPLTQAEMNACNGFDECGAGTTFITNDPLPPLTTPCDNATKCTTCSPCQVARVYVNIHERGANISTAQMVIGQEYEIRELGGFCWTCFGVGGTPIVGQRFTATACNMATCAPCLSGGLPKVFADCPAGVVLPIYRHHFEVRGRGHLGHLWEKLVANFESGLWQYTEDTTETTERGFLITGYSATSSGESYVGDTQIVGGCCDSPHYFGNHPDYPEQLGYEFGCQGCLKNLYVHYEHSPQTTPLQKKYYGLPANWFRLVAQVGEKFRCFRFQFTVPPVYGAQALCCGLCDCTYNPCPPTCIAAGGCDCCPFPLYIILPEYSVDTCEHMDFDWGGSSGNATIAQTEARALRVGTGQNLFSGLTANDSNAVFSAGGFQQYPAPYHLFFG